MPPRRVANAFLIRRRGSRQGVLGLQQSIHDWMISAAMHRSRRGPHRSSHFAWQNRRSCGRVFLTPRISARRLSRRRGGRWGGTGAGSPLHHVTQGGCEGIPLGRLRCLGRGNGRAALGARPGNSRHFRWHREQGATAMAVEVNDAWGWVHVWGGASPFDHNHRFQFSNYSKNGKKTTAITKIKLSVNPK